MHRRLQQRDSGRHRHFTLLVCMAKAMSRLRTSATLQRAAVASALLIFVAAPIAFLHRDDSKLQAKDSSRSASVSDYDAALPVEQLLSLRCGRVHSCTLTFSDLPSSSSAQAMQNHLANDSYYHCWSAAPPTCSHANLCNHAHLL